MKAIEQLATQPEYRSLAYSLTQNEEHARDLLQEATYLILKSWDSFQPGSNFAAWAKTIIRNAFITDYRKVKRRRGLIERDQPQQTWTGERVVDNLAEQDMTITEINRLIDQLPPSYRRAFRLHLNGVKYKDIAVITNSPIGTAKSRVNTARRLLKTELAKVGVER